MVTMWTLHLEGRRWTKEEELSAKVLWGFDSLFGKKKGLPQSPLMFPILTSDGALCVSLPAASDHKSECSPMEYHIYSFDVRRKRLLWHVCAHAYHTGDLALVSSWHPISYKGRYIRKRKLSCL